MISGVKPLKIATYNLKNLFLSDEGALKPRHEVRPLARMIDQVEADILALQEVGSQASLEQLNGLLEKPYEHCHCLPGNSNRSIHIAVLSRIKPQICSHRDRQLWDEHGHPIEYFASEAELAKGVMQPLRMQRNVVQIEFSDFRSSASGGQPVDQPSDTPRGITLFAVHLKSKGNAPWQTLGSDLIRAAECRLLAQLVLDYQQRIENIPIVVLGDFNDLAASDALKPLRALKLHDPLGDQLLRMGRNPSTYWPKRGQRLDRILLCANAVNDYVENSAMIHASQMARQASDHFPVSLQVEFGL